MNKKVLSVLCCLALCLLMSGVAMAAVQTFEKFSVEVPAGWTSSQQEETVLLTADDKSAAIAIVVDSTNGATLDDVVTGYVKEFGASEPAYEEGAYTFTFKNAQGVDSTAVMVGDNNTYALFIITGENPQVDEIMMSLEAK